MKTVVLLLLLLYPIQVPAQREVNVTVLDVVTKQPVKDLYLYILKDQDKVVDINKTDSFGNFIGKIDAIDYDLKSTYQVLIDYEEYNRIMVNFDPKSKRAVILYITENKNHYTEISGMIYKDCSSHSFGSYEPKEPRSLLDLPEDIRDKVVKHLIRRLGSSFYSRLTLTSGQIVNLARLQFMENYRNEYQWQPHTYYLCFAFRDTSLGIARFTAKIVLDKHGKVIEEIELPNIEKDSSKNNIISMKHAIEVAKVNSNGYLNKDSYIDFKYDYELDCLVWSFWKESCVDKKYKSVELIIRAHNGALVEKNEYYKDPCKNLIPSGRKPCKSICD
ncbi:MAG: hypothetical protein V4722_25520 [Bacteroidota bacterium]